MRPVFGSSTSLVMPSVRSSVIARPDAAHGKRVTVTSMLLLRGLGLGQAAPRELRVGEDHRRDRQRLERRPCARRSHRSRRAPRAMPCAPASARRPRRRSRRSSARPSAATRSTSMKPRWLTFTPVLSRPGTAEFGRRPIDTSTRSNVRSFGMPSGSLPSNVTLDAVAGFLHAGDLGLEQHRLAHRVDRASRGC